MLNVTDRSADGSRFLLLDLIWTLAIRTGEKRATFADVIAETESYRLPLLERIRAEGFFVVMLTARSLRYRAVTLENIRARTSGWQPDVAIFNEDDCAPPLWKRTALHRYVYPAYGAERSRYFALESNHRTRRMYAAEKITAETWENYLGNGAQLTMNW